MITPYDTILRKKLMKGCFEAKQKALTLSTPAARKKERKRGRKRKDWKRPYGIILVIPQKTNLRTQNTNYKWMLENSSMMVRQTGRGGK